MTQTVTAIYEGGVLRPTSPLSLPNGATVHLTFNVVSTIPSNVDESHRREVSAFVQSLIARKDRDELPEGYDFLEALDANRSPGERPLFPPELKGVSW